MDRRLGGPQSCLDAVAKIENSCSCQESNPCRPDCSLVRRRRNETNRIHNWRQNEIVKKKKKKKKKKEC
jgi:hypothetical protein